jgi:hypothetical protein
MAGVIARSSRRSQRDVGANVGFVGFAYGFHGVSINHAKLLCKGNLYFSLFLLPPLNVAAWYGNLQHDNR